MRKIGVVHSQLKGGGSDMVCFWTIEALKNEYDVSLITFSDIDISKINEYCGTKLDRYSFKIINPPLFSLLRGNKGFWLLKQHLMMRYCKYFNKHFDLLISTFNEIDFGVRGIQYVHFPALAEPFIHILGQFPNRWYYRDSLIRKFYRKLCRSLSGFSQERMKQNITLVNSAWTAQVVKKVYGIESIILYPPVAEKFFNIPWEEREEGFVCIGRVTPEKRIDAIIRILSAVRKAGWDIHLHIVGPIPDSHYKRLLKPILNENASWISLEGMISREALLRLVSKHKYGIHGMQYEHFGIAVAEMVKAGCIVFVPGGGGQVEVVDDERLIYNSEREAVWKIITVLSDKDLQLSLLRCLASQAQLFSTEHFINQIRDIVKGVLC
jgi:glycosyltransferase involved in cell wall biosynthesis